MMNKQRTWVTKENIKRWREAQERYAQEHYDLSHRGDFEILKIGKFTDLWLKMDCSKITTKGRPVHQPWYAKAKYLLWAQNYPHLYGKRQKPTKEHYIFVDKNFKMIQECGTEIVTFKIPNGVVKKMIREDVIKSQTSRDIIETKILLMSE